MKWSCTFLICMPIAFVLFVPAAWLVISGVRLRRDFEHERNTPLAEMSADVSKPGTIEIPVRVTYPAGHGFKVLIKGPLTTPDANEMEPWLQGLEGTIAVVSGPYVPAAPSELGPWHGYASGFDSCAVARIYNSPPGNYLLRLEVSKGAPALQSSPHKLAIMNDVCGCELLGVFWGNLIAVALTIFGLAALGVGFSVQCSMRRGRNEPAEASPATTS